jgi:hypothetical protein
MVHLKNKLLTGIFVLIFCQTMQAQNDRFAFNLYLGPSFPLQEAREIASVGVPFGAGIEVFPFQWLSFTLTGIISPYFAKNASEDYGREWLYLDEGPATYTYRSSVSNQYFGLGGNVYVRRPEIGYQIYLGSEFTTMASRHNVKTTNSYALALTQDTVFFEDVELIEKKDEAFGFLVRLGVGYRFGDSIVISGELGFHATGEFLFIDRYVIPRVGGEFRTFNIMLKTSFTL